MTNQINANIIRCMNNAQDNIQKRRDEILNYINLRNRTNVNEISDALQISPVTVRRDLKILSTEGKISTFFGGVRSVPAAKEKPAAESGTLTYRIIQLEPSPEKRSAILEIAKMAADLIEDGDVILMNNSLTASYTLEFLGNKSVMVVTNCLFTLARRMGPNVKLCFLGGQIQPDRAGMIGGMVNDALTRVTATKCIMGLDGIDILSGLTCKVLDESYVNQKMIQHTHGKLIVVAEGGRIANKSAFYCGDLKDISFLITDDSADTTELSHFINNGINVHVVHPNS